MEKYFYVIIFAFLSQSLFGQYTPHKPYEKIKFENVNAVYHTAFQDPSFNELGSDGYNCIAELNTAEPLVFGNLLFTINFNTLVTNSTFGNYYITCLNLDNGIIKWRSKVFLEDTPNMEIPRILKINKNNELEIIGQKKVGQFTLANQHHDLVFFKRTYSVEDGALLSFYHQPLENPAYLMTYWLFNGELFFESDDKNFQVIEKFELNNRVGYRSMTIDESGELMKGPDTIMYKYFDGYVNSYNIQPIGQDSLLMVDIGFDSGGDAFIGLRYLTFDLKPINEIKFKSPVVENLPYISLAGISSDKEKVWLSIFQIADSTHLNDHTLSVIIDKSGNILNMFRIELKHGTTYEWSDNEIQKYGRKIGIVDRVNPSKNLINFSSHTGDFESRILKEYVITDSTRLGTVVRLFRYKDLEIAFVYETAFLLGNFGFTQDYPAGAYSIIAFKKGDFIPDGLLSFVLEENNSKDLTTIKSYPNPSSGPLTLDIKGITGQAEIRVFDMLGRNVYVQDGISEGETTIDLSGLTIGTYVYKIYQGRKEVGSGQWVRI